MRLEALKVDVLDRMVDLGFDKNVTGELSEIELGFLRRDATQRHGVTRFQPGIDLKGELGPQHIRKVDLHRELITGEWWEYGAYVLFHEYCHCLGNPDHGRKFRSMESLWPDHHAKNRGAQFTDFLRRRNAKWIWCCTSCNSEHPRSKRANGRYKCRKCDTILVDKVSN